MQGEQRRQEVAVAATASTVPAEATAATPTRCLCQADTRELVVTGVVVWPGPDLVSVALLNNSRRDAIGRPLWSSRQRGPLGR